MRRTHVHKLALAVGAALAMVPVVARAEMECTHGPGVYIRTKLVSEDGARLKQSPYEVALLQLPGGTAEYTADGVCTLLTFTAIRNGEAVYTDDGLGRGLTVVVGKDRKLTITHVSGWNGQSE
jgi:hypothetical protein